MTNDYGNLELHTVLLSAMKDIDKICRENGLRYYLHAGTLLGAMNHKGFIPWDDDVDISLFRDDYEKFNHIMQTSFPNKYFVRNYHTDPHMSGNRTELCILGTEVIHIHGDNAKDHHEIYIDIVPLDAAPDSHFLRCCHRKEIFFWDVISQIKLGSIEPHNPVVKLAGLLAKMDRKKIGGIIDKISMRYNNKKTKLVGLLTYTHKSPFNHGNGYDDNILPRAFYEAPSEVQFEGQRFMTISNPEVDLDRRYPNWREPYPEEKRVTKHDVKSYYISDEVRKRVGL